jgi:hypothetical protein
VFCPTTSRSSPATNGDAGPPGINRS